MKIKRHTNINATNFEYLSVGTVFQYLDGKDDTLYMKIQNIVTNHDCDTMCYVNIINAIDLNNGKAMCFSDCDTVFVIDGEFVTNE
jgi:hypothetical protein